MAEPPKRHLVIPRVLTEREALQNYATIAGHYNDFIENRLPGLENRIYAIKAIVEDMHEEIKTLKSTQNKLPLNPQPAPLSVGGVKRHPSIPDPDLTPHGGIRFDVDQWEAIQAKLAKQEEQAKIKEAEARGAQAQIELMEAQSAASRKKFMKLVKVLGGLIPVVATIASLLTHFFHSGK